MPCSHCMFEGTCTDTNTHCEFSCPDFMLKDSSVDDSDILDAGDGTEVETLILEDEDGCEPEII